MQNKIEFILSNGSYYYVTEKQIEEWQRLYSKINVKEEVEKLGLETYHIPATRKTSYEVIKYINNYLMNIKKEVSKWE